MNAVVFSGPTLDAAQIHAILPDAVVLPPVAQGDVYRAMLRRPAAIGIIDGYFERVPAVWHKEILWAMSEGVHVFGAASMGALRAAELEAFGMVGVGSVFESYRNGDLEDDDEVAVIHATEEYGFRPSSEAMVNIRATMRKATQENIIAEKTCARIGCIAKSMFYATRHYSALIEQARCEDVPEEELIRLQAWLPQGKTDVKREDALAMLESMRQFLASNPGPKHVSFVFEETVFFEQLKRVSAEVSLASREDSQVLHAVNSEVAILDRARYAALAVCLARQFARREYQGRASIDLAPEMDDFLKMHGSGDDFDVADWMEASHCTPEDFHRILEGQAMRTWAEHAMGSQFELAMLDYLRWTGEYHTLLSGAAAGVVEEPGYAGVHAVD